MPFGRLPPCTGATALSPLGHVSLPTCSHVEVGICKVPEGCVCTRKGRGTEVTIWGRKLSWQHSASVNLAPFLPVPRAPPPPIALHISSGRDPLRACERLTFPSPRHKHAGRASGACCFVARPAEKSSGSKTQQPANNDVLCTCACCNHFYHLPRFIDRWIFFSALHFFLLLLFLSSSLPPCLWWHLDLNRLWTFEPDCAMTKILSFTFCAKVLYKNTSTKRKFRKLGVKIYSQQSV